MTLAKDKFAICETGGKQYRVREGETIRVESLPGDQGDILTLDQIKLISIEGTLKIGTPNVAGASVSAEIVGSGKDKKIIVFKYKAKTIYRRKNGHRQDYTDLRITQISAD